MTRAISSSSSQLGLDALQFHVGTFSLDLTLRCDRWPLVVLGPSGAGKTQLLRLLAGLDTPHGGRLEFAGQTWFGGTEKTHLPTFRRSIGYCLQDPLLFPHLTVLENVTYPLAHQRPPMNRADRLTRGREELARWGAQSLAETKITGLSGGEQSRVALARAFARRPDLLLLDEPLAALDPPSREELLVTVRHELQSRRSPAVWVTHDRDEAFFLGETVAVLLHGRLAQVGSSEEVFRRPASAEVAAFVGVGTVLHGLVQAREAGVMRLHCGPLLLRAAGNLIPGTPVVVTIRSEDIEILPADSTGSSTAAGGSARNEIPAVVASVRPMGLACLVELDAGVPLTAAVTRPAVSELALTPGSPVRARMKAVAVQVKSEEWERGYEPPAP